MSASLLEAARQSARAWMGFVEEKCARSVLASMLGGGTETEAELMDAFACDLPFGTGGMRGRLGLGPNRINPYTIGRAAQGFSQYLLAKHRGPSNACKVAIAYDSRHMSAELATHTARVLRAQGLTACLFKALRPTPLLAYAVRHLNCHGGIVITASHNPKEYNGFKVYREDGAQIVSPEDAHIMARIQAIPYADVRFGPAKAPLHVLGEDEDNHYLDELVDLFKAWRLQDAETQSTDALRILYTPLHGTGLTLVPALLNRLGYPQVALVKAQTTYDGDFPTVSAPNPEEENALAPALAEAKRIDAELVLANDPDADRLGVIVKGPRQTYKRLDGNQIGALLTHALLEQLTARHHKLRNPFMVKTIVTSPLIGRIAETYQVPCYEVPTGFKYIGEWIRKQKGKADFVLGVEESYGYLVGDMVRDKDGVASCGWIAALASRAKQNHESLWERLLHIYEKWGWYQENLYSLTLEGQKGKKHIASLMAQLRKNPPKWMEEERIIGVNDYLNDTPNNDHDLPKFNMIGFTGENESRILIRPSGTEPKIKCYCSLKIPFPGKENLIDAQQQLQKKAERLQKKLLY